MEKTHKDLNPLITKIKKVPAQKTCPWENWSQVRFRWVKQLAVCFGLLDPTKVRDPPMPPRPEENAASAPAAAAQAPSDPPADGTGQNQPEPPAGDPEEPPAAPAPTHAAATTPSAKRTVAPAREGDPDPQDAADEQLPPLFDPDGNVIPDMYNPRKLPRLFY